MLCIFSLIYLVFLHLRKHSSILGEMMKTKYDNKVKKLLRDNDDNSMGLWTENHTLMPCEQRTIDRNSQLPVSRCISSLSPAAWSPPNFKWIWSIKNQKCYDMDAGRDQLRRLNSFGIPDRKDVLGTRNEWQQQYIFQASY